MGYLYLDIVTDVFIDDTIDIGLTQESSPKKIAPSNIARPNALHQSHAAAAPQPAQGQGEGDGAGEVEDDGCGPQAGGDRCAGA